MRSSPARILIVAVVAIAMVFGIAGAQQTYSIAALMKTLANPFWGAMGQGITDGAVGTGSQLILQAVPSETDVEPQLNACLNLLQRRPDVLLAAAINSVNLLPCLRQANAQGVLVVDLDGNLDPAIVRREGIRLAFTISSDNFAAGGKAADFIVGRLGAAGRAAGKVLVIEGLAGNVTGAARRDGFVSRLRAIAPGMTVVASLPGNWDRLRAADITNDILIRHPDLAAIYAANDTMALGAVEALFAAGRGGRVVVVGTDGNADAVASIRAGRLDASVAQLPYLVGKLASERAVEVLRGGRVDQRQIVDTLVLSKDVLDAGTHPLLQYVR